MRQDKDKKHAKAKPAARIVRWLFAAFALGKAMGPDSAVAMPWTELESGVPTDSHQERGVLLNPALYTKDNRQFSLFAKRSYRQSEFTREDLTVEADSKTDGIGVNGHLSLPDGLSLGLYHYRTFTETTLASSDRDMKPEETFNSQHSGARLNLDLSPELTLGLVMRHLQIHNAIFGSFNTQQVSRVKGSMTGLGSGLGLTMPTFQVSLSYFQPLQGKTEILKEEKRLTEPGLVQVAGKVALNKNLDVGLGMTRFFFREDDLAEETTAEDDNSTQIDLRGMNPNRFIFPIQHLNLSVAYKVSERTRWLAGFTRVTSQVISDSDTMPDANNKGLAKLSYLQFRGGVGFTNGKLSFNGLASYYKFKEKISGSGFSRDGTLSDGERSLLLEVGVDL